MFVQVYCSVFCFAIFSQCGDTLVRMGNVREEKKEPSRTHGNQKYAHGFNIYQWMVYRINPLFEHRNQDK